MFRNSRLPAIAITAALAGALAASTALAQEKKAKPKSDAKVDALFGDEPVKPTSSIDDLKRATDGVSASTKTDSGLAAKSNTVDQNAPINVLKAFAAAKIEVDKAKGCQPVGKDKTRLTSFEYDEVPAKGPGFDVCVTLASTANREVHMSVAVVDPRGAKIARAEDVVNFAGVPKLDHVLEFPPVTFKNSGQHFYVIDIDGKEAGRVPLFNVKIAGQSAPSPSAASPAAAAPSGGQPLGADVD